MGEYAVARWRRYGNDRLYVTAPDGTKVGWICLRSGQKVVEALEHWPGFDQAVADWRERNPDSPARPRRTGAANRGRPTRSCARHRGGSANRGCSADRGQGSGR